MGVLGHPGAWRAAGGGWEGALENVEEVRNNRKNREARNVNQ